MTTKRAATMSGTGIGWSFFQGITESAWEAPVGYSPSSNWIQQIPQGSQGGAGVCVGKGDHI